LAKESRRRDRGPGIERRDVGGEGHRSVGHRIPNKLNNLKDGCKTAS
jgi:hypothetical protein